MEKDIAVKHPARWQEIPLEETVSHLSFAKNERKLNAFSM